MGGGGVTGVGLGIACVAVSAAAWGIFRVDGDPRPAPIPVPGMVRLTIEALFFASAVVALSLAGEDRLGGVLAAMVVVHYVWGHRRVRWLVRHPGRLPDRDRFHGDP